uniref:Vestigial like family member 3 n=1 Tax=Sarcophilus harrisii TaxID=9305 RepID=A0A7N4PXY6_SARHA
MSCAEVMYHPQPYGATQYLPNSVAAASCPTAYYHTASQSSQQKKLAVYSKMQESLEMTLPSKQEEEEEEEDEEEEEEEEEEKDQPAEMEYLNSRCVLFTYFQGDIGSVVDEHFSRALGQPSSFHTESAISKSKMGLTPLWRDSSTLSSQRSSFPASFWTSSYQPPPRPCLSGVHPDFSVTAPGTFAASDPGPWPGHNLHQTVPPPPPPVSESWHYPLTSQSIQPGFLLPSVTLQRQILLLLPLLPQHGLEPFMEQWTLCQVLDLIQVCSTRTRARSLLGSEAHNSSKIKLNWESQNNWHGAVLSVFLFLHEDKIHTHGRRR